MQTKLSFYEQGSLQAAMDCGVKVAGFPPEAAVPQAAGPEAAGPQMSDQELEAVLSQMDPA